MKKYIISLALMCLFVSNTFAQEQPRYIANPTLDKFVGTWEAVVDDFQITFIKEKRELKFGISADLLFGYYTYKKGGVRLDSKKSEKRAIDFGNNSIDNRNELDFDFIDISNNKKGRAILELLPGTDDQATLTIYPREVVTVGKGISPPTLFFVPTKLVMKKMNSFPSMSQQTALTDIVNITLPKKAEKLTEEKLQKTEQPSANIDPRRIPVIDKKGKGDFYRVNGILMQLIAGHGDVPKDFLEDSQAGIKEISSLSGSLPPNYHSQIKNINNFRVLIIYKDVSEHVGSYSFFSVNNSNTSAFNGIMEFYKPQKEKATAILDEMLKSVTFK